MTHSLERLTFSDGAQHRSRLERETIRLHQQRYALAATWARGRRVLDLACGAGYGSAMMAHAGAERVIGVDIAPDAIAEATRSFNIPGTRFFCSDYRTLDTADANPDLLGELHPGVDQIVSLETIEHLPDPADFLRVVLRHLRPGGIFVGSVPITPSMDANPFHLHDFTRASFLALLRNAGLKPLVGKVQRQPFNPFSVRKEMRDREGLRKNLRDYYLQNPDKLLLRLKSTLTDGFCNKYLIVAASKPQSHP
jgi:2-polyprenyl-3-methyl-5-hydroxy-6-metoxy-1,4-benzoquinol methylase